MSTMLKRTVYIAALFLIVALTLLAADQRKPEPWRLWPDVAGSGIESADTMPVAFQISTLGPWPPDPPPTIIRDSGRVSPVRYLIITSPALKPVFTDFAAWKKKKGIAAHVWTTTDIASEYPGDSLQQKIRNCVKDYYTHWLTDWVLIGGDYRHVPAAAVCDGRQHQLIHTDEFYVCLGYNWNEDGDEIFGESEEFGDLTDSYEELAIGRIPAADSNQARVFINKLIAYETDTTKAAHLTKALLTSTDIDCPGNYQNLRYLPFFPSNFVITYYHQLHPIHVMNALLAGQGIIINTSHSQSVRSFLTYYVDAPPDSNTRKGITNAFFDTTTTNGEYSIFINSTCHYGSILNDTTVARSYLFNLTGWGVGYLGPMDGEHDISNELYDAVLERLFDTQTIRTIGEVIKEAKEDYLSPFYTWPFYHWCRTAGLSIQYFGDPQMTVFTDTPGILHVSHPDWLPWGMGAQSFDVTVTSGGVPVSGALVTLLHENDIDELTLTDGNGVAHFSIDSVPEMSDTARRYVAVTASKAKCFTSRSVTRLTHCGIPGDANDDCAFDVSDPYYLIDYIFVPGTPPPPVMNRADANVDCTVDISDAGYMIQYIFVPGSPAPQPGCVTSPAGGKPVVGDADPNDHETPPYDLQASDQVEVIVSAPQNDAESGVRIIELNSQLSIYALSLTLKTTPQTRIGVVSLLRGAEDLSLHVGQWGTLVKIGLIDTLGRGFIRPGTKQILRIIGDFDIQYSIAATVTPGAGTVRIRPKVTDAADRAGGFVLDPNYPNPFNPTTDITFRLPRGGDVTLEVLNILGQRVATLADGYLQAGIHRVTWDASGSPSGVYMCRLRASGFEATRKMVLLK